MRVALQCFPCFLRQALIAAQQVSNDPLVQKQFIDLALGPIEEASMEETPAHVATRVYRKIAEKLDGKDPFRELKHKYTRVALEMMRELQPILDRSDDPLDTAIRTSVAGNVIDFGIFSHVDNNVLMRHVLQDEFGAFSKDSLESDLESCRSILFLADNAGELVFDRPLISYLLRFASVDVVVKSVPVINDATIEDADESELPTGIRVLENGSDCVGTILSTCSDELQRAFGEADVIISKGQANFETLDDVSDANIYFLFKAKCEVTAGVAGVAEGSLVALSNRFLPAKDAPPEAG